VLTFNRISRTGEDRIGLDPQTLVTAGWAGRDEQAIQHHSEELAAIGVPRPSSVPVYYRVSASNLTQSERLVVLGPNSSGEVEPVLVALADGYWIGIGSDHTDRKAETAGIALSKQLCGKPVGTTLWRLEELEPHWDQIIMRSWAMIDGERVLYQEGKLSALRTPRDLIDRSPAGLEIAPRTVMYCRTLGAIGGIRPGTRYEMELEELVLGRAMRHAYEIEPLSVVS